MSNQSPSSDLVLTMKAAQTYLYRYACPLLMLIGTVSCILNLIIFRKKTLQKSPCSLYFIVYNLANFYYIYSSLLSLTLDVGYHIDPSASNLIVCRLRLYFTILFNCLGPFYLVLASVDRVLVTSPNALIRQRSTRRLAWIWIVLATLFWAAFHSHALIATNIIEMAPHYFVCYFQLGTYITFVSYYSLIKELGILVLLTACSLWSVNNMRQMRRIRAAPNLSMHGSVPGSNVHSASSKDRQLILMLLMDITIYILFSFVFASFLMYQQITQNAAKSADQIEMETAVRNLCLFCIGIPFCINCYTNLLVSKTFRREVKKILSWKRVFCRQ